MEAKAFIDKLTSHNIDFFAGVPDSLLNAFCVEMMKSYPDNLTIGVNEGACVALASGHHLATKRVPCVFMQNSGLGNIVNPYTSLAHPKVYGIPMLFVVGWRGEPETKDEPQHKFMGEVTLTMLDVLGIKYKVLSKDSQLESVEQYIREFAEYFDKGESCAFVIKKGTFSEVEHKAANHYEIVREKAIEFILSIIGRDNVVVSTTGKISRELFEARERNNMPRNTDFLTVGSMGFASSIAAQIARDAPTKRVLCIDGDGAALMHMGTMATIGNLALDNFTHVILDNELHESVGGVPTISNTVDWTALALSCGYKKAHTIKTNAQLGELKNLSPRELYVIKVAAGSRSDLGRPTTTPQENKNALCEYIGGAK